MDSMVQDAVSGRTEAKGIETQPAAGDASTQLNPLNRFIGEQNISRFVDQFQIAHDPHRRQTLQKLLLEEENRFGFNSEQLERIQQRIKECQARIDQHDRLINKARINGHNLADAERVLGNLIELREVFWSRHQVILEALNRSKI